MSPLRTLQILFPIANVPLIEYTLEFLFKNAVKEVIVVCGSHFAEVQEHVEKSVRTGRRTGQHADKI